MFIIILLGAFMVTMNLNLCTGTGNFKACIDELLKGTDARGRLKNALEFSTRPIFELKFVSPTGLGKDKVRPRVYKAYVSSNDPSKIIKEVKILYHAFDTCDVGLFVFSHTDFYRNTTDCGRVLGTKKRNFSMKSPFLTWRTPDCGCIQFRAIVISDDAYYADDADVPNGPLSQIVCITRVASREKHLKELCSVVRSEPNPHKVIINGNYVKQNNLDVRTLEFTKLYQTMLTQLEEIKYCCTLKAKLRPACVLDIRNKRIHDLCYHNRIDHLPMANFKVNYTWGRKDFCCKLHEVRLYNNNYCFDASPIQFSPETILDYSYDVTDPVNDLAIYGNSSNKALWERLTTVELRGNLKIDEYKEPFEIGTNMITTDSSETKLDDAEKKLEENICCQGGETLETSLEVLSRPWHRTEKECGDETKTFVSQNLISNFSVCMQHFYICCVKKYCCASGISHSFKIASRNANVVWSDCWKGYSEYLRQQGLKKMHHEACRSNFQNCCYYEKFKKKT